MSGGVVMLAGGGVSTRVVYNALARHFAIDAVLVEKPVAPIPFLMRRMKRLGVRRVLGQALFQALAAPWLRARAKTRIEEVKALAGLDDSPIDKAKLVSIPSVNSDLAVESLARLDPRVVVVNGTRIISRKTLAAIPATLINLHAGITPRYRGVHGAYWALVENNRQACGVTVHRIDAGIDTGAVLAQAIIEPSAKDSFVTYPLLQLAAGLPAMVTSIRQVLDNTATARLPPAMESKLWSHPTLWQYLQYRWRKGVR